MPSQFPQWSTVVRILTQSKTAAVCRRLARALRRQPEESDDGNAGQGADSLTESREAASLTATSKTAGGIRRIRRLIEQSFLYRWLTADPDPDVIVIDLRETRTVGPLLGVTERGGKLLASKLETSKIFTAAALTHRIAYARPIQLLSVLAGGAALAGMGRMMLSGTAPTALVALTVILAVCGAVGSRVTWSWSDIQKTRGYRAMAAAFEPPEPPEREGDENPGSGAETEREASGDGTAENEH